MKEGNLQKLKLVQRYPYEGNLRFLVRLCHETRIQHNVAFDLCHNLLCHSKDVEGVVAEMTAIIFVSPTLSTLLTQRVRMHVYTYVSGCLTVPSYVSGCVWTLRV